MRKRRSLTHNWKNLALVLLLVASTFFYTPIEASAEEIYNNTMSNITLEEWHSGEDFTPFNSLSSYEFRVNVDYEPDHTYLVVFYFTSIEDNDENLSALDYQLYFTVGGVDYPIAKTNNSSTYVYVEGNRMSQTFSVKREIVGCTLADPSKGIGFAEITLKYPNIYIEDLGATENFQAVIEDQTNNLNQATQNQTDSLNQATQEQTDSLINGFDDSQSSAVEDELSANIDSFQSSEDALFSEASDNLSSYEFYDISSNTKLIQALTIVTLCMTRIFDVYIKGIGADAILSILFAIMLVAMGLGLYRLYQSNGHKQKGGSKGGKK